MPVREGPPQPAPPPRDDERSGLRWSVIAGGLICLVVVVLLLRLVV